jgi:hypothetical protein
MSERMSERLFRYSRDMYHNAFTVHTDLFHLQDFVAFLFSSEKKKKKSLCMDLFWQPQFRKAKSEVGEWSGNGF